MIGIKQKGIAGVKVMTPNLKDIDFEKLPRYISYKAALLKQKIALEYFLIAVVVILGSAYISERSNNASLVAKLREKEYIVLPDFITVSPQSVSEEVINLAISDFISHLGKDFLYILTSYLLKKVSFLIQFKSIQKRFNIYSLFTW